MQRDEIVNAAREASAAVKEKAVERIRATTPGQAMTLLAMAVALLMVVSCFAMGVGLARQKPIDRPAVVAPSRQIAVLRAEVDRLNSEIDLYAPAEPDLVDELKRVRGQEESLRAENKRLLTENKRLLAENATADRIENQKMDEVMSAFAVQRINNTYKGTAESYGLPMRDFTGEPHCLVTDNGPARVAVFNRLPGMPGVHLTAYFDLVHADGSKISGTISVGEQLISFATMSEEKSVFFWQESGGHCSVFTAPIKGTPLERIEKSVSHWEGKWK